MRVELQEHSRGHERKLCVSSGMHRLLQNDTTRRYCLEFLKVVNKKLVHAGDRLEDKVSILVEAIDIYSKQPPAVHYSSHGIFLGKMFCLLLAELVLSDEFHKMPWTIPPVSLFLTTLEQAVGRLELIGSHHYLSMALWLVENHWCHPVLAAILLGKADQEQAANYVQNAELPEILYLRLRLLVSNGLNEMALHLSTACLKHSKLGQSPDVWSYHLALLLQADQMDMFHDQCHTLPCCLGAEVMEIVQYRTNCSDEDFLKVASALFSENLQQPLSKSCCTQRMAALWLQACWKFPENCHRLKEQMMLFVQLSSKCALVEEVFQCPQTVVRKLPLLKSEGFRTSESRGNLEVYVWQPAANREGPDSDAFISESMMQAWTVKIPQISHGSCTPTEKSQEPSFHGHLTAGWPGRLGVGSMAGWEETGGRTSSATHVLVSAMDNMEQTLVHGNGNMRASDTAAFPGVASSDGNSGAKSHESVMQEEDHSFAKPLKNPCSGMVPQNMYVLEQSVNNSEQQVTLNLLSTPLDLQEQSDLLKQTVIPLEQSEMEVSSFPVYSDENLSSPRHFQGGKPNPHSAGTSDLQTPLLPPGDRGRNSNSMCEFTQDQIVRDTVDPLSDMVCGKRDQERDLKQLVALGAKKYAEIGAHAGQNMSSACPVKSTDSTESFYGSLGDVEFVPQDDNLDVNELFEDLVAGEGNSQPDVIDVPDDKGHQKSNQLHQPDEKQIISDFTHMLQKHKTLSNTKQDSDELNGGRIVSDLTKMLKTVQTSEDESKGNILVFTNKTLNKAPSNVKHALKVLPQSKQIKKVTVVTPHSSLAEQLKVCNNSGKQQVKTTTESHAKKSKINTSGNLTRQDLQHKKSLYFRHEAVHRKIAESVLRKKKDTVLLKCFGKTEVSGLVKVHKKKSPVNTDSEPAISKMSKCWGSDRVSPQLICNTSDIKATAEAKSTYLKTSQDGDKYVNDHNRTGTLSRRTGEETGVTVANNEIESPLQVSKSVCDKGGLEAVQYSIPEGSHAVVNNSGIELPVGTKNTVLGQECVKPLTKSMRQDSKIGVHQFVGKQSAMHANSQTPTYPPYGSKKVNTSGMHVADFKQKATTTLGTGGNSVSHLGARSSVNMGGYVDFQECRKANPSGHVDKGIKPAGGGKGCTNDMVAVDNTRNIHHVVSDPHCPSDPKKSKPLNENKVVKQQEMVVSKELDMIKIQGDHSNANIAINPTPVKCSKNSVIEETNGSVEIKLFSNPWDTVEWDSEPLSGKKKDRGEEEVAMPDSFDSSEVVPSRYKGVYSRKKRTDGKQNPCSHQIDSPDHISLQRPHVAQHKMVKPCKHEGNEKQDTLVSATGSKLSTNTGKTLTLHAFTDSLLLHDKKHLSGDGNTPGNSQDQYDKEDQLSSSVGKNLEGYTTGSSAMENVRCITLNDTMQGKFSLLPAKQSYDGGGCSVSPISKTTGTPKEACQMSNCSKDDSNVSTPAMCNTANSPIPVESSRMFHSAKCSLRRHCACAGPGKDSPHMMKNQTCINVHEEKRWKLVDKEWWDQGKGLKQTSSLSIQPGVGWVKKDRPDVKHEYSVKGRVCKSSNSSHSVPKIKCPVPASKICVPSQEKSTNCMTESKLNCHVVKHEKSKQEQKDDAGSRTLVSSQEETEDHTTKLKSCSTTMKHVRAMPSEPGLKNVFPSRKETNLANESVSGNPGIKTVCSVSSGPDPVVCSDGQIPAKVKSDSKTGSTLAKTVRSVASRPDLDICSQRLAPFKEKSKNNVSDMKPGSPVMETSKSKTSGSDAGICSKKQITSEEESRVLKLSSPVVKEVRSLSLELDPVVRLNHVVPPKEVTAGLADEVNPGCPMGERIMSVSSGPTQDVGSKRLASEVKTESSVGKRRRSTFGALPYVCSKRKGLPKVKSEKNTVELKMACPAVDKNLSGCDLGASKIVGQPTSVLNPEVSTVSTGAQGFQRETRAALTRNKFDQAFTEIRGSPSRKFTKKLPKESVCKTVKVVCDTPPRHLGHECKTTRSTESPKKELNCPGNVTTRAGSIKRKHEEESNLKESDIQCLKTTTSVSCSARKVKSRETGGCSPVTRSMRNKARKAQSNIAHAPVARKCLGSRFEAEQRKRSNSSSSKPAEPNVFLPAGFDISFKQV